MSNDPTTTTVRPPCYLLYNPYLQQQNVCYRCGYDRQYYETIVNTYFDLCGECDSVLPLYNATCGTTTTTTTTTTTSTTTTTTTTPKPTTTLTPTTYPPTEVTPCPLIQDSYCKCCEMWCYCQFSDSLFDDWTDPGPVENPNRPCHAMPVGYDGGDGTPRRMFFPNVPYYVMENYQITNGWVGTIWNTRASAEVPFTSCVLDSVSGQYFPPDANISYTADGCAIDYNTSDLGCMCSGATRPGSPIYWFDHPYYSYGYNNVIPIYDMDCPWISNYDELNGINVTLYMFSNDPNWLLDPDSSTTIPPSPKKCSLYYRTKTLTHEQWTTTYDDGEGWSDWVEAYSMDVGKENAVQGGIQYSIGPMEIKLRCSNTRCHTGRNCPYDPTDPSKIFASSMIEFEGHPSWMINSNTMNSTLNYYEENYGPCTMTYTANYSPGLYGGYFYQTIKNINVTTETKYVFGNSGGCCSGYNAYYGYYGAAGNLGLPSLYFSHQWGGYSSWNYYNRDQPVPYCADQWPPGYLQCPMCRENYSNNDECFEVCDWCSQTSGSITTWNEWKKKFETSEYEKLCRWDWRAGYNFAYMRLPSASFVPDPYVFPLTVSKDEPVTVDGMWSYTAQNYSISRSWSQDGACTSSSISPSYEYSIGKATVTSTGFTRFTFPSGWYPGWRDPAGSSNPYFYDNVYANIMGGNTC